MLENSLILLAWWRGSRTAIKDLLYIFLYTSLTTLLQQKMPRLLKATLLMSESVLQSLCSQLLHRVDMPPQPPVSCLPRLTGQVFLEQLSLDNFLVHVPWACTKPYPHRGHFLFFIFSSFLFIYSSIYHKVSLYWKDESHEWTILKSYID